MTLGVSAAVFATFVWSMNFVVPFIVGRYSIFDLALLRFGVSALAGACVLLSRNSALNRLSIFDWFMASWLAFLGYVGFFLSVTGAAAYAGPVIAPAFLGLVPIVVAVAGNLKHRSVPWKRLAIPLTVIAFGLALVNGTVLNPSSTSGARSILIGIPLAILAVTCWTWFALLNQSALTKRPHIDSMVWTGMMLVTGGAQILLFFPIGLQFSLFGLATNGASWSEAHAVYIGGSCLALLSSAAGAWAWTVASRRLPVALSAQLVVLETVFGFVFGQTVRGHWPTLVEMIGISSLIFGVILAIRIFYDQPQAVPASSSVP